jgi:hypothetical protein
MKGSNKQMNDFNNLCNAVSQIDKVFEDNTAKAINKNITARNWLTGYYIVNYEQNGNDRAQYGAKTLQKLAEQLNKKSLSYRNLKTVSTILHRIQTTRKADFGVYFVRVRVKQANFRNFTN